MFLLPWSRVIAKFGLMKDFRDAALLRRGGMRRQATLGLIMGFCLVLALGASTSLGQAVFGSIFGTVTDPQGAAVAGAKVTVTSVTKATTYETTTNESGNYTVTHLIPDTYRVKVEGPGFKAYDVASVEVSADASAHVDAQLQVGAVTQTVEVTSEVPQLKTDRADVSIEFNSKYAEELPILNRNFTTFELLTPGTEKLAWTHAATENPQASQQIMVNGQHFSGTAYELDGTDNQDPILGIIVVNPNLDAIQEAKMTTQNYDAEFGKAVAGVVTVQTKSGTNDIHGSAFWDRYTDATRARDPFTQATPDPSTGKLLPSIKFNQFGGTVGGPIIKNKLFFFADYQGTRSSFGVTQQVSIPTTQAATTCAAALGNAGLFCDLSQYQPRIGNGKAGDPSNYIYDPSSSAALDGSGRKAFCGAAGEVLNPNPTNCATPFLIPGNMLSAQAIAILKAFPASRTNANLINNYIKSGPGPFVQNSFDTREDYNISPTVQLFGRFSLARFTVSGAGVLGALGGPGFGGAPAAAGLNGQSIIHNYSLASGVTKTFNPTLIADFRFGYFKYNPHATKSDQNATPMTTLYNVPNMNTSNPATGGLPDFHMDGTLSDFGDGLNVGRCNCPLTESEQQFQGVTNWTKIRGNHTLKFGADIRFAENLRVPSDSNRTGEPVFNAAGTGNAGQGGLDLATFLLGDVTNFSRYVSTSLNAAERQKRYFFYGQDTFRLTPKLTFNFGLRWEFYPPEYVNAPGNGGFANLTDGYIHVGGFGGYSLNGNIDDNWKFIAPRVGIAYQIKPKTVIRLGYGRSYDMGVFGSNFGHAVTQNLPVLVQQHVDATNSDITGGSGNTSAVVGRIPAFTLAQGPPIFTFPAIPANGLFPLEGPGNNLTTHIRATFQNLPALDAWNATVQHQLTSTINVEVAYVGNKGTHEFDENGPSYNVNQFTVAPGRSINGSFQAGTFSGPGGTFVPITQASRRPLFDKYTYQNFLDSNGNPVVCCSTDVGNYYGNNASTNYNALTVKVEKRFSQGLQFLTHYTYSRSYDFNFGSYADNPKYAYGPDSTNRNHAFVASIVYALPVGKGQKYMGNVSRLEDLLVGGWQLSNTSNWSGGSALTASYGECGQDQDSNVCRPDIASGNFSMGARRDPTTGDVIYFNPIPALAINAPAGTDYCTVARPSGPGFARPACGTIGNVGRNSFRGPHAFLSDMALSKSFLITERIRGAFHFDAFNVFNHVVLANPGNMCIDCTGPAAGGNAGQITDINGNAAMRQLQFGLKFTF